MFRNCRSKTNVLRKKWSGKVYVHTKGLAPQELSGKDRVRLGAHH